MLVFDRMPGFEMYDRVEANYMGSGKWYSGIIVGVYFGAGTSSYDVAYDDGDREAQVPVRNLKAVKNIRRDRGKKKIAAAPEEVGKVEARSCASVDMAQLWTTDFVANTADLGRGLQSASAGDERS